MCSNVMYGIFTLLNCEIFVLMGGIIRLDNIDVYNGRVRSYSNFEGDILKRKLPD